VTDTGPGVPPNVREHLFEGSAQWNVTVLIQARQGLAWLSPRKSSTRRVRSLLTANRARGPESCGHTIQLAESGEPALELLANDGSFDLVLTDYRMAELNGLELLQQIKRQAPETPVILTTAYATIENAVAAMKAGAYDYLVKPSR
jgi:CheY-like chemotaxis protein